MPQVDPALYDYLQSKSVSAKVFAFPLLLSLFACVPPLDQVGGCEGSALSRADA
jgi:cell cycle arrest protein BUB2